MEDIEKILLKMLPNQEGRNKYFVFAMQKKWQEICGENVAKHSKPVRLDRRILYINTNSSVLANHLLLMKQQFITNINRCIPNNPVKDIKFFTGSVEKVLDFKKEESEVKLHFLPLNDSEKNMIGQSLKQVKNKKLQKKLSRFSQLCLQRKKALLLDNANRQCKSCGAPLVEEGEFCRVCKRYEKEKLLLQITSFLKAEPWLNYNNCQKYVKCDKIIFNSVKNSLKQYYYQKIYNNQANKKDEMTAVMLKTCMPPEEISEQLAENILKGLRRR